jgi:hypothetical protein
MFERQGIEPMDDLKNLDETQQNRLLRRVDWRFLLANPKPEKSICFANGILKQAVGAISSTLINFDQVNFGECELAVAINPTNAILKSARDALGSGGEIYTEWYFPWIGGVNGVRQRLEKFGFTDITCYWAWPPPKFASPLYWLPVNSTKVLRYHFRNRPASSSGLLQIARFVLQMFVALGLHTYFLMPVCAMARKPALDRREGLQEYIKTEIARQWQNWGWDQVPSQLTWLLWTPGHRPISKIVAMVFSEMQEMPALVIKIPRSDIAAQALKSEASNLTILSTRKPLLKGIPHLLFTLDWKGSLVVGESFVVGTLIYTYLNRDNYRELALKVTDWLLGLATEPVSSPRSEWWDRLVGSAIKDFDQSFGSVFNSEELSCIRSMLNDLNAMPLVFEQRDCSPWNILINDQGDITVLDWESAEPKGLPALDLIYFLTHLSFFLQGAMGSGNYMEAYRNAYNPESFTGKINKECQEKYCAQTKIDLATLQPLRLLTWLIHSRHEYRRLAEDAGCEPSLDALRAGLFSRLAREEIRLYNGA